ncbi:MAG: hypothetical protein NVSMB51_08060 [Solirubrobacteraceae bacterium]
MPWTAHVLVVANLTAGSTELLAEMRGRAAKGPTRFTLLIPRRSTARLSGAEDPLDGVIAQMLEAELDVELVIGDSDPILAVSEAFDPRRHDEIVVSTLPADTSKWLQIDWPHRIARITGAPVKHIVATPPAVRATSRAATPPRRRSGVLRPLEVLTWSGGRRRG